MSARRIAVTAMVALALEVVLGFTVLQGAPNPVMAAVAVIPLLAAWVIWREWRWAPVVTVLSAVTVVGVRMSTLSFDLVRPGDVAPFALALATFATIGTGLVAVFAADREQGRDWLVAPVGLAVGAVLGLGLVVVLPQLDDTDGLSAEQLADLPTIEMVNFKFEPGQLRVTGDQPVAFRFTNDTDGDHSFAIDALDLDVQVPSGRTRVVVVDAGPGTYPFQCSVGGHADDGMKGRLVVDGERRVEQGVGSMDVGKAGHVHAH